MSGKAERLARALPTRGHRFPSKPFSREQGTERPSFTFRQMVRPASA